VKRWTANRVGLESGSRLVRRGPRGAGPQRVVIDSRSVEPGDLFVGIPGERADGGSFAAGALEAGAWGVIVQPQWAATLAAAAGGRGGAVLAAEDPVAALGTLARGWRRELGADVIAVTGSVGKTSTKDLIAAMIAPHRRVAASRANFNTEIGLPLELLAAPAGTEVLVLELAMRGFGQIARLTEICEPDVGVVTNVGPVHLEQMGDLTGVARAKGELLRALREGATAVIPAGERLLEPHVAPGVQVVTFGPGGDVGEPDLEGIQLPFTAAHNRRNAQAAVAAARAVGVEPAGRVDVAFSALRGEQIALPQGAVVINDCYNANPLSMRAALDDLAAYAAAGRRLAVLGDMLELGPDEARHHREIGEYAAQRGVDVLVAVGPRSRETAAAFGGESHHVDTAQEAASLVARLLAPTDVILVKGSRGVGLEVVAEHLAEQAGLPAHRHRESAP
jgi:UDP-N-acetylmuramoyl-tripeptide--D-alanyl-D-alanine ligase